MPDDENTTQDPILEESTPGDGQVSIPTSPQGPTEQGTENTAYSEPSIVPPETLEGSPSPEPVSEPVQVLEPSDSTSSLEATAQIPVNELLPVIASTKLPQKDLWKRFLDKVQIGKRKKLEKIMSLFLKQSKITNDQVEKFLHISDATATRYFSILKKEGKIKQNGKTGKGVSYSKL